MAHLYLPRMFCDTVAWALASVLMINAVGGCAYCPPETTETPVTFPVVFTNDVSAAPLPKVSVLEARTDTNGGVKNPDPDDTAVTDATVYDISTAIAAPVPAPPTTDAVTPVVVAPVPP